MGLWRKRGAGGACAACLLAASLSLAACAAPGQTEGQPPESLGPSPAEQGGAPAEPVPDQALLATLMGDADLASRLVSAAEADEDVRWIATHPDALGADGASTQRKLLSLAATEPAAVPFVRGFPERYPAEAGVPGDGPEAGQVPHLYQWDERWGYQEYGSGMIGWTGCGPTCMSMLALYFTGNEAYDPVTVAQWAEDNGYYVSGSGTSWTFMSEGCAHFGLKAEELPLVKQYMINAIEEGRPIVCAMAPGDFTTNGHYIILTGYDEERGFTVNDPNSPIRSGQHWTYEQLEGQISNLWAFSKA